MGSIARQLGRQLLTCRSCANLFYVRADNKKPLLARIFESSGFAPLPVVRAWKTRAPKPDPAAWLDRTDPDGVKRTGKTPMGGDGAAQQVPEFPSSESSRTSSPNETSMPGTTATASLMAEPVEGRSSMGIDQAAGIATVEQLSSVALMEPEPVVDETPVLGRVETAIGTPAAHTAVDALFTKPTRQVPVNIRQWQDHSWEVLDWNGNVWGTSSAAASGGSAGMSATVSGEARKAG